MTIFLTKPWGGYGVGDKLELAGDGWAGARGFVDRQRARQLLADGLASETRPEVQPGPQDASASRVAHRGLAKSKLRRKPSEVKNGDSSIPE